MKFPVKKFKYKKAETAIRRKFIPHKPFVFDLITDRVNRMLNKTQKILVIFCAVLQLNYISKQCTVSQIIMIP